MTYTLTPDILGTLERILQNLETCRNNIVMSRISYCSWLESLGAEMFVMTIAPFALCEPVYVGIVSAKGEAPVQVRAVVSVACRHKFCHVCACLSL